MNLSSVWPSRWIGAAPTLKEVNLVCWGLFLALLILPLYSIVQSRNQLGQFLQTYDADFVNFYTLGRLLNEQPVAQLYDYEAQRQIADEVHPLISGVRGPLPYPPYVAMFFQPFARLSYQNAYLVWLGISLLLYLSGIALVTTRFLSRDPLVLSIACCLALSFYPFAIELMVNGHLSAVGFFAVALALWASDLERPVLSGLALSICLYKPTLAVLFVPMLLVTRQFQSLIGFAMGGAVLVGITTLAKGFEIWVEFYRMYHYFSTSFVVNGRSFLPAKKYVDLMSFTSGLPGGRSTVGIYILAGVFGWIAFKLVKVWWKSAGASKQTTALVWAATITWTLVTNVYMPMYDTILAVISVILTAGALRTFGNRSLNRWFGLICLALFATYWVTERIYLSSGIQAVTLVLFALGAFQLWILGKDSPAGRRQMPAVIDVARGGVEVTTGA